MNLNFKTKRKFRKLLTLVMIFSMLVSLSQSVWANDGISVQEIDDSEQVEEVGEIETLSNDTIVWTNKGEFPYITSVTITDSNGTDIGESSFNRDQKININFYFSVPNTESISAGDMFTITIPDGFELVGDLAESQLDESSGIDVTWELTNNVITIRFYQSLDRLSNVSGYMSIGCWFDQDSQLGEDGEDIIFEIAGHEFVVDVYYDEITNSTSAEVTKKGTYNQKSRVITWTITVTPDSNNATLAGVTVKDYYDTSVLSYAGSFEVDGVVIDDSQVTFTEEGFEYQFPTGTNSGVKVITFKTTVKDSYFLSDATIVENSVATYMPNGDKSSEATAEVTVEKQELEKVSTNYNALTKTISWRIVVNQDKLTLPNAIVIDEYCAGTSIVEGTIQVNGVSISSDYYVIDDENNTLTIYLGDIDDEVVITYDMVITDEDELELSAGMYNVYNQAKLISENIVIQEGTGSRSIHIVSGDITINKYGSVRSNSTYGQYIQWEVWINSNTSPNYKELTDDVMFYDQLPEGLTLFEEGEFTVTVRAVFPDGTNQSIELNTSDVYNSDTREVNINATQVLKDNGVEVTADCTYVIIFATKIVNADDVQEGTFTNTAYVTVGDQTNSSTETVDVSYDTNTMIAKSGTYDYATKTYDWTIKINQDKKAVKNATITDNLPEGHVPAYDYIYVGEQQVPLDGTKVNGITATYNEESNTITVSLEGYIAGAREIYISTKYVGEEEQGDATNEATLSADNIKSTFTVEATVEYKSLPVLEKRTSYIQGDTITWEVVINLDHDNLGQLTLVDQLSSGLSLDTSSVKLYLANISSDGTVTSTGTLVEISGDEVQYDDTTGLFTIVLPADLDTHQCYILFFETIVQDKSMDSVTNSITFYGTYFQESATSEEIILKVTSSSSGIVGEAGSVKIKKLDSVTNEPLEGVAFQLLNQNKEVVTSAGWAVTNSEGIAEFTDWLRLDTTYYVQEVRTIDGYVYDDTLYEVTVSSSSEVKIVEITVYNTPEQEEELVSIEGTKTWVDGDNQDGIRPESITVNLLANGEIVQSTEVTAEDDWSYSFSNLPKYANGEEIVYTISEEAVEGYEVTVNGYDLTNTHTPETEVIDEFENDDTEIETETKLIEQSEDTNGTSSGTSSAAESTNVKPVQTGDTTPIVPLVLMAIISLIVLLILIRKRNF